jgi:hypothetical protein
MPSNGSFRPAAQRTTLFATADSESNPGRKRQLAVEPILGKRGMMRNLLIEAQSRKPAPRQMHAQLLTNLRSLVMPYR